MTTSDRTGAGDPDSDLEGAILATFDWSATAPTEAVVRTVAIAADAEPTGIEPIFRSIDPDALDALVGSVGDGGRSAPVTVSFTFVGHDVTVGSDGTVAVRPRSETD